MMNRLKVKPFGWKQVNDISEVNLYDYIKNRFVMSCFFLTVNLLTLLFNINNVIILYELYYWIGFIIVYVLISYHKIKRNYIMWYWIIILIPINVQAFIVAKELKNHVLLYWVIYIAIYILSYVLFRNFDKDKVKTGKPVVLAPFITIISYYYVKSFGDIGTILFCYLAAVLMCLYNYYEIKYVLRNNTEYKKDV